MIGRDTLLSQGRSAFPSIFECFMGDIMLFSSSISIRDFLAFQIYNCFGNIMSITHFI